MSRQERQAIAQGLSDVLGSADLLGSIISSDRTRGGRALEAPTPEPERPAEGDVLRPMPETATPAPAVIRQYDSMTDRPDGKMADQPVSKLADSAATALRRDRNRRARGQGTDQPDRKDLLEVRISDAQRMARSPTTTVTLRLPRELNDWLDEYVHRSWPQRVRKQELVGEALRLLYARRGRQGEAILDSELLEEAGS
jgi:hypothetical protein